MFKARVKRKGKNVLANYVLDGGRSRTAIDPISLVSAADIARWLFLINECQQRQFNGGVSPLRINNGRSPLECSQKELVNFGAHL
jgi:hypothetical protein